MEKPGITEMLVSTCTGWVPRIWRVLLLLAVILVLGGCTAGKKWKYLPATRAEERSIYVIAHGWHAGIALSSDDLGDELGFIKEHLRQGKYYEFGWGEADFYQADEVTAYIFLKAVFWRNSSVMHLLSVPEAPAKYFSGSEVIELKLSKAGLKHLKDRLRASFKFDERNRPYPLKGGLHGESRFFKAEGYYLITHTCNRWTAKILESGGGTDGYGIHFARRKCDEAGKRSPKGVFKAATIRGGKGGASAASAAAEPRVKISPQAT